MSKYEVTYDVPVPEGAGNGRGGTFKYPWYEMEPGGSFAVVVADDPKGRSAAHIRAVLSASGCSAAKRAGDGRKYATRLMIENGQEVVRVFRVK